MQPRTMTMLIVLKLCVTALLLVTGAGAQVDICDNVPVLMANSTPQILTSVSIETDEVNLVTCSVQIVVSTGFDLKLNFTSVIRVGFDPIVISPMGFSSITVPGVTSYVLPVSATISIFYDVLESTTFVMEYQEVETSEVEDNRTCICDARSLLFADTTVREIVTPNFGNGLYFNNLFCQVEILNVIGASVWVEVTDFDVECGGFDEVIICDGVVCHNLCDTSQRIFFGSPIRVTFTTDGSLVFAGMRLEYTTDLSDWTPWMSMGCCEYNNCQMFVKDTRTRNCLVDSCQDELFQDRTRVCSRKCADCLLR